MLAIDELDAFAWTPQHEAPMDLMGLFKASRRQVLTTVLEVLRRIDSAA